MHYPLLFSLTADFGKENVNGSSKFGCPDSLKEAKTLPTEKLSKLLKFLRVWNEEELANEEKVMRIVMSKSIAGGISMESMSSANSETAVVSTAFLNPWLASNAKLKFCPAKSAAGTSSALIKKFSCGNITFESNSVKFTASMKLFKVSCKLCIDHKTRHIKLYTLTHCWSLTSPD